MKAQDGQIKYKNVSPVRLDVSVVGIDCFNSRVTNIETGHLAVFKKDFAVTMRNTLKYERII